MRKITKELTGKSIVELEKESQVLKEELTRLQLEAKVKPQKDTNLSTKKRKRLAVVLTMMTQKRELEEIKKEAK